MTTSHRSSAIISATVSPAENGITLFDFDCWIHVEYSVSGGELDWQITAFEVRHCTQSWDDMAGKWMAPVITASAKIGPDHLLFAALHHYVDADKIAADLVEQEEIILGNYREDEARSYRAAVL